MSGALIAPVSELLREARWWFLAPSSGVCSVPTLILGFIVVAGCCFCTGALVTLCLISARCRSWLWHCISGLAQLWGEPLVVNGHALAVRNRFREYRDRA